MDSSEASFESTIDVDAATVNDSGESTETAVLRSEPTRVVEPAELVRIANMMPTPQTRNRLIEQLIETAQITEDDVKQYGRQVTESNVELLSQLRKRL